MAPKNIAVQVVVFWIVTPYSDVGLLLWWRWRQLGPP